MTNFDRILAEARTLLTEEERLTLSERLLHVDADPAVEEAWKREVAHRRAEWKAGKVNSIPLADALELMFAKV